jgi:hypothetical protein
MERVLIFELSWKLFKHAAIAAACVGCQQSCRVSGKGMPGGQNMKEGSPVQVLTELQAFRSNTHF